MTLSMWEKYCGQCGKICSYGTHRCPECGYDRFTKKRPQRKFESRSEKEYLEEKLKSWRSNPKTEEK